MPDILGLYWTLQVELLFYGLIALLLLRRLLDKPWVSVICAFTFLALSGGLAAVRYYLGLKVPLAPSVGLSLMFAGNFWFWFSSKRAFTVRQATVFYGCFMLCLYAVAYFGYHRDWGYGEQPSRFIFTYSLALLLFLGMSRIVKQGSPALLYLGAISYSLYLFHELVMFTLWERLGPYADGWLRIAICTAISVAAAGISFRLIECPGIAMGKRIINRNGWNTRTAAIPGV
jgi:peptidoglycan/LPS O-acetylase OafA/YrhL